MKMMRKNLKKGESGFSLIELMIVIGIVALLVGIAIPSYQEFVRKARRGDTQQLMMNYANLQEIWRSNNAQYATAANLPLPTHENYTIYVRAAGNTCANSAPGTGTYNVVACPSGDQTNDTSRGTSCSPLSLDQSNGKTPAICWE